jgi:hypothetical protein
VRLHFRLRIRSSWWYACGIYYGYPECCVEQFSKDACNETVELYPEAPWIGTGFIPCPACAQKIGPDFSRFVDEVITPRRIEPVPFSVGHGPMRDHKGLVEIIENHYLKKKLETVV